MLKAAEVSCKQNNDETIPLNPAAQSQTSCFIIIYPCAMNVTVQIQHIET
jgi:hypothetical protein